MKRKGFTIFEAVITLALAGITVLFFVSTFTSAYRWTTRSRVDTETAFTGQKNIEELLAEKNLQGTRHAQNMRLAKEGKPIKKPVDPPDIQLTLWDREVSGYSVRQKIESEKSNPDGTKVQSIQGEVIGFAAVRKLPPFPVLTVLPINKDDEYRMPKLIYWEEFMNSRDDESLAEKGYSYSYEIDNVKMARRFIERGHLGSRVFMADRPYIARPFTDFAKIMENLDGYDAIGENPVISDTIPVYSSYYSRDYITNDLLERATLPAGEDETVSAKSTIEIYIPPGINFISRWSTRYFDILDVLPLSVERELYETGRDKLLVQTVKAQTWSEIFDELSADSLSYRDVAYVKTGRLQTISGHEVGVQVMKDNITWFVGTPVIEDLAAQWDANLIFDHDAEIKKYEFNQTAGVWDEKAGVFGIDDMPSYKKNVALDNDAWKDIRTLQKETAPEYLSRVKKRSIDEKLGEVTVNIGGQLKTIDIVIYKYEPAELGSKLELIPESGAMQLKVRDGSNHYRSFSAGVELQPGTRLMLKEIGQSGLGDGTQEYSVIMRAKPLGSGRANLFSINMRDDGMISSISSINNEANQFFINGNQIQYRYDDGMKTVDPAIRYWSEVVGTLVGSPYDTQIANDNVPNDDREGYHIFEMRMKRVPTDPPDKYLIELLVDGNFLYKTHGGNATWSDIEDFGITLGSNLEISDILVYDRALSDHESERMATYLIDKYTVS